MDWLASTITLLRAICDVLIAGVAIISFSLFIYSITFQLHDRVTNSFTLLLFCLIIIFGADAFMAIAQGEQWLTVLIKIHWYGIIFLPTIYFHFSDALLTITGKPSRGRRKIVGFILLFISVIFACLLFTGYLIGEIITDLPPAPFLLRTIFIDLFTVFFIFTMGLSWFNFIRTYYRTATQTSRRRMLYLIISALGPALGSFPYLLYGSKFAQNSQILFWVISILTNTFVYTSLIAMTYSVSFFGFPWTDRLIKSRLFRWVMRGPVTASLTLGMTTIVSRLGVQLSIPFISALVVLVMVFTIVMFEYLVTLFAPIWERIFFIGNDRAELEKVRILEDRILTSYDIQQFLEMVLASICDRLQINGASLIIPGANVNNLTFSIGDGKVPSREIQTNIFNFLTKRKKENSIDIFGDMRIIPLILEKKEPKELFGVIVFKNKLKEVLDIEKSKALSRLVNRASLALFELKEQEKIMVSLEMLAPQQSAIQNLLALSRYNKQRMTNGVEKIKIKDLEHWIKEALTHIWGGPRMLRSPLLQLRVVQVKTQNQLYSPVNAVREVFRDALMRLKPEGERLFTNEWILYNLIDLKFFEGWMVKDVARKLAISEADFYRKQRIAINALANQIIDMERSIVENNEVL